LSIRKSRNEVDVCYIVEGSYPYVSGGVSSWLHDLITANSNLSIGIVALLPSRGFFDELKYELPSNVEVFEQIYLGDLTHGTTGVKDLRDFYDDVTPVLTRLQHLGGIEEIDFLIKEIKIYKEKGNLGEDVLLNSHEAWDALVEMYSNWVAGGSFLDYFWSWRALQAGLYAVLIEDYPLAKVYHTVSTGYAGVLGVRAKIETGRPLLLTEHGIYTNERRIELTMAEWLHDLSARSLGISKIERGLHRIWINVFHSYARACYSACDEVITLYEGNQKVQISDGADPSKTKIIPNGTDVAGYAEVVRDKQERPTIALIGRVVSIKDIKTYIRSVARLMQSVPDLQALVLGPKDEEQEYVEECENLVEALGLENVLTFTGRVKISEYLGIIDVIVLTSVSEAQPLVILEAGSAGIPVVATDVGACSELIFGRSDEQPNLGAGGGIVPLANPLATAQSLERLLLDDNYRDKCGEAMRNRVAKYYNKVEIDQIYSDLYANYMKVA
jgi:polysaccharide biosynthesis protein PelF